MNANDRMHVREGLWLTASPPITLHWKQFVLALPFIINTTTRITPYMSGSCILMVLSTGEWKLDVKGLASLPQVLPVDLGLTPVRRPRKVILVGIERLMASV